MITPYYGEFLTSPFPLELSLNYCSHKCAYCFANLNRPDRKANIGSILRLIEEAPQRISQEARLLREGFPILISNKVDPFAASNHQQAVPLIEILLSRGLPLAFQTKGGRGVDDVLSLLPGPVHFYVSISFLDDDLRRKIEPGAPPVRERLDLIERLKSRGHVVTVGVNPLVPEWLPDPAPLFAELLARGVSGVWMESLHLNNNQTRQMNPREKAALADVIPKAYKKRLPDDWAEHFVSGMETAMAMGLAAYCINCPFPSTYWDEILPLYPRRFPIFQEVVNWAFEHPGEDITFQRALSLLLPHLPASCSHRLADYIGASSPYIRRDTDLSDLDWTQLLSIIWDDERAKGHPSRNIALFYKLLNDDETVVEDDHGLPVYTLSGESLREAMIG